MSLTAVPSRITIDFRDAALPSRTWILGVDEAATARMELIAFEDADNRREKLPRRLSRLAWRQPPSRRTASARSSANAITRTNSGPDR